MIVHLIHYDLPLYKKTAEEIIRRYPTEDLPELPPHLCGTGTRAYKIWALKQRIGYQKGKVVSSLFGLCALKMMEMNVDLHKANLPQPLIDDMEELMKPIPENASIESTTIAENDEKTTK
jgi:hypothetical protein